MNAKDLIHENNKKRKLLTEENEEYYSNMMLYIRTDIMKSEQQVEELLMELLDHLLEAQEEGRSAEDVFGDDPKAYCKEMLKQLPKETGKSLGIFLLYLGFIGLGWMAIAKGTIETIGSFFIDIDQEFYVVSSLITVLVYSLGMALVVVFLLKWIQYTTFKEMNKWISYGVPALVGSLGMLVFVSAPRIIPQMGFVIEAGGVLFLVAGVLMVVTSKLMNKKYRLTE
ncbi:DUF1129 family protein [Thalassobacillus hwangdonensis]|uniref:DUF1129 family protein n=1 Tax=Thalassobacillus hwangdonensis TaxID=546108 RepID=A0ABW3KZI9_9BACI